MGLRFVIGSLVVAMLAAPAAALADPLEEATAAYKDGDYETVLSIIRPLAEEGNAEAQNNLGFMYRNGYGVDLDVDTAAYWYQLAAEQGNVWAQGNLGAMYFYGYGVPRDNVRAYLWFELAANQGDDEARFHRDRAAGMLTGEQLDEAERLVQTWLPKAHP